MSSGFKTDPSFYIVSGHGADQGFTEDEAYALLAGLDDTGSTAVMPMVAAVDSDEEEHTGAMVALVPSDADIERLLVEDGEPADQLHLTLMFLGEAVDIAENTREQIIAAVQRYAEAPLSANGFSVNVFNPTASNSCIVMGVGNDDGILSELHSNVSSSLGGLTGLKIPEQHTPWVPHVTLAYTDEFDGVTELGTRTGPITFDKIRVAFGSEVHDIPLESPMVAGFLQKLWKESEHPRNEDGEFIEDAGKGFAELPSALTDKIKSIPKPSAFGTPKTGDQKFRRINGDDAADLQQQMFRKAGRKWTRNEEESLRNYTSEEYGEYNGTMRGDPQLATLGNARGAENIQSAMMPSPVSFIATRAADGIGSIEVNSLTDLKKLIGAKIRDRAFLSTAYADEGYSFQNRKFSLEIEIPEGTPLAFASTVSQRPKEREALLAAGTVLQLISATEPEKGRYHVKLRVVPEPKGVTTAATEFAERDVNAPGGGHSLRDHWVRGPGAAKIMWGTDGSFARCVSLLGEHVRDPQGLCAEYHKAATGEWPAEKGVESSLMNEEFHGKGTHPESSHGNRHGRKNPTVGKSSVRKPSVGKVSENKSKNVVDDGDEIAYISLGGKHVDDMSKAEFVDTFDNITPAQRARLRQASPEEREGLRRLAKKHGASSMVEHELGPDRDSERDKYKYSTDISTAGVILTAAQKVAQAEDEPWEGVLTVEGEESGDGRLFGLGSLDWAELPMPLMYQPASVGGHDASVLAGAITFAARKGKTVFGRGHVFGNMLDSEYGDGIRNMMETGGVSVDVDKVKDADVELVFAETDGPPSLMAKPELTVFHRGRIRGATLVAFPAFVEAKLSFTNKEMMTAATESCGCGDLDGDYDLGIMVASGESHTITIPNVPPAAWFSEPTDVQAHGALTITDEGRVFGWLAPAAVTHRSVRKTVPMGANVDYSRFMKGETIVAGGGRVVSGVVTGNCGHADTENYGTLANRKKHYDDSCSVFANIAVGQKPGKGVWVAGALRHGVTAEQVAAAMGCTLSGDWQPHPDKPGVQEFIAALLVPVPGFAMARTQASVKYEDGALIAAAIPIQFGEAVPRPAIEVAQELINDFKYLLVASLDLDAQSQKDAIMADLEME